MNVLVILGHPNSGSFNHAVAETCYTQITNNGHAVVFHDLYKEKFDSFLGATDLSDDQEIKQHCSELKNCDGIIIIHPNWWGQPPAIVKGWLEQVFLPDIAYTFQKDDKNVLMPKGLLKAQAALVFNTSNTTDEVEEKLYKTPLETLWKNRVFRFCGISNFKRLNFSVMKDSTHDQRTIWLTEIRLLIDTYFPKEYNS